jgi:translocation protein SEC63
LLLSIIYGIYYSSTVILTSTQDVKGFDPYEILNIEENAPIEKIKKAYRKLALLYHPDRNQDNPEAAAKFIMISKAYECLTNE